MKSTPKNEPEFPAPKSILVVLSGGQDSCTCLFSAVHTPGVERVAAISFDYGQRHARELDSASFVYYIARTHAPTHVEMPKYHWVKQMRGIFEGNSPLTDLSVPLEQYTNVEEMDAKLQNRIELTFVPGRNAVFLSLAYSYAAVRGFDAIMTGVNGADNANYPDCTEEFISSLQATMQLATRAQVQILTPLQHKSKREIVDMARRLPGCWDALAYTTTDYEGKYPPGNNHSSVLRQSGFSEAKYTDPLIMRARSEGFIK